MNKSDLLHGVTLEMMLNYLVERLGFERMARTVDIRCFKNDPSVKSSLVFLRRTPWARQEVEALYVAYASKPKPGASKEDVK